MSVIRASNNSGSVLSGTSGDDTLIASFGADTLTGGAGSDTFTFNVVPWSPGRVTDFTPGVDRIDLSLILHSDGYTGSNPVADHWLYLVSDGRGGTMVEIDQDGPGAEAGWADSVTDLVGVSPSSLQLGRDILWRSNLPLATSGSTASGGAGSLIVAPNGYAVALSGASGDDTLVAGRAGDTLSGGAGRDLFRLPSTPDAPVHITDFTPGADQLDLTALAPGYHGTDPLADGYLDLGADGSGGTYVWLDPDGPGPQYQSLVADLEGVGWTMLQMGRDVLIGGASPPSSSSSGVTLVDNTSTGTALVGGPGNDTLIAGTGPDKLVGGGGSDTFVFNSLPFNSGHVSDFTPGQDVLDLRGLASAYGYGGSNAVADGWLVLRDDGHGDTQVFVNTHDGSHAHIVTVLDGVAASSLHQGDWLF